MCCWCGVHGGKGARLHACFVSELAVAANISRHVSVASTQGPPVHTHRRSWSPGACCVCAEGAGISAVEPLRTLCGPADPELAQAARPSSLRAQLGGGAPGKNAVHCTDLEEDAQLEVGFFWLQ